MMATILMVSLALPAAATAQRSGQQAPRADQKPPTWPMEEIQGFHVVLVVGETERGKSTTENLTEAAARALKDMSDFLPYKSYRVLDAQWSSCCSGPQSRISGRLQGVLGVAGPNGVVNLVHRPYTFSITARSAASGIQTRFVLVVPDERSGPHAGERAELERMLKNAQDDVATLESRVRDAKERVDVGVLAASELRDANDKVVRARRLVEELQLKMEGIEGGGNLGVMDSSFTMDAGETVVVGTSKLGGDKALIAIVTAVRKR
jgi:hypothetical protein